MEFNEIFKEKLKRRYEFTLKASDLNKEVDEKLEKEQPSIQMKGFRKGKVPISLLKKIHGETLLSDAMKNATDSGLKLHFEKTKEKPAQEPKVELVNKDWKAGEDVKLSIEYECMPKIPSFDLSKINLEKVITEPDKKTIEEAMNNLRQGSVEYKPLKKTRKSQKNDQIILDFEGFVEGKAFENGSAKDFPLVLGSNNFIPGFEDQLLGVKRGDNKLISVKFPDDYGNKELSGKQAEFRCQIKEVQEPFLPKIDDDLAKKFGLENIGQLKENLEMQVKNEFDQASKTLLKKKLMDKLEKELKFDLPETLVTTEANSIASHREQGKGESLEVTKEDKKIAERRVRVGLFFAEFGVEKNLDLSTSELEKAFENESKKYPGQEKEYMKFIKSNLQAQQAIRAPLFEEKIVNSMLEAITLKNKKLSVEKFREQMEKLEQF